jgi:hypothetical protein
MKELIGFLGRLFFVYGIPGLAFLITSHFDVASGGVIVGAMIWMFIFHFITKDWEYWGSK